MVRYFEDFPSQLQGMDFETLENNSHPIFGLTTDLSLSYLNPAWFKFAAENRGEPDISERFGIGTAIGSVIAAPLQDFYLGNLRSRLQTGKTWSHDYECSSPTTYRLYHQTVYPLHNHRGLVVVNSLVKEQTHDANSRPPLPPSEAGYRQQSGLIIQCCHCRRTERASEPGVWDWIPAWVERMPPAVSHGLCRIYYLKFRTWV
jgi:hypothetical protein